MLVIANKKGELGIDNLKKLFTILITIYAKIKGLIKKFELMAVIELMLEVLKYKDDLKIFEVAWAEIKDLDTQDGELKAIVKHLEIEAIRLGLPDSDVLSIVSETLLFLTEVLELWKHGVSVYEKGVLVYDRFRSINIKERISE